MCEEVQKGRRKTGEEMEENMIKCMEAKGDKSVRDGRKKRSTRGYLESDVS